MGYKKNKVQKSKIQEANLNGNSHALRNNLILGAILLYTFILFFKSLSFQLVNWDDPDYIIDNFLIKDFSVEGFKKIFSTPVIGMYNPIPFVLYAFEYKFWELAPRPYHWFNLIFHLLATVTIYKFIFRLTKRYEVAAIVAFLFAVHPMHVSVVTWASQTKTSLFIIFYFIGLTQYLQYVYSNYKVRHLVFAALLFILAVLSKPSAVSFAPMLFLLDYYLSRKIERRLFIEKIPFFVIALFFGIVTILTHSAEGDTIFEVSQSYSPINNFLVSNYAIVFYFYRFFYPLNLSTIYPYPEDAAFLPLKYYLSVPVIPLIIWLVLKSGKFKKEMVFGILFFALAIAVLIRIIPSGFFGVANRYTYLSYTGLFFILGQFFVYVMDNKFSYSEKIKKYVVVFFCLFFILCTWRTTVRINVWENSITLFDDIIKKKPNLTLAYNQRALAKRDIGDYPGAIDDLTKSLEIDSLYVDALHNRGVFKMELKKYDEALVDLNNVLRINPDYFNAYNNIGNIEFDSGNLSEALINYNNAIRLNPKLGQAYFNRALVKISLNDTVGAVKDWKKAEERHIFQATPYIEAYGRFN